MVARGIRQSDQQYNELYLPAQLTVRLGAVAAPPATGSEYLCASCAVPRQSVLFVRSTELYCKRVRGHSFGSNDTLGVEHRHGVALPTRTFILY